MWDSNQKYSRAPPLPLAHSLPLVARYPPRQLLKLCVALLVIGYTLYAALFEVHARSYVWQSTVLADFMYSDLRSSCDYNLPNPSSKASSQLTNSDRLKIGIIVLYGKGAVGEWGDDIMKLVLDNRYAYANLHGYEIINANALIDPSRPVAWSKLLAVNQNLQNFDYVMYIDMDAVIMEPGITIESLVSAGNYQHKSPPDIIMQNDWNGPNTGIWLARNKEWTRNFLQMAWDQGQLVSKTSATGISHPFEYEQRSFHYLLDTEKWRERKLPTFGREKSEEFNKHISFLPQCAMNSYTLHPLDFRHAQDRKKSQYIEGDFIIHFAGKKGSPKMNLLRHYLMEAAANFREHEESLKKSPK